jgi:hypothetical protein
VLGVIKFHARRPLPDRRSAIIMTKRKRSSRATNKIAGSLEGTLIKVDADPYTAPPAAVDRAYTVVVARSTNLLSAELEAIIEIIAKDRVYRTMLAGLGRRLLMGPPP